MFLDGDYLINSLKSREANGAPLSVTDCTVILRSCEYLGHVPVKYVYATWLTKTRPFSRVWAQQSIVF